MKDTQLVREVEYELSWDPKVNADHIGVNAYNGAITLTGYVSSYMEKDASVRAAGRVYGVQAVADEIEVRLPHSSKRDDPHISEAIQRAFEANVSLPESVKATVRDGFVTLRGEVDWNYQRRAAKRIVRDVSGVVGVASEITLKPGASVPDVENRVTAALKRSADLDARSIWVTATDGTVHLHGHVHSISERRTAETAAFAAPGVSYVDNEITIAP